MPTRDFETPATSDPDSGPRQVRRPDREQGAASPVGLAGLGSPQSVLSLQGRAGNRAVAGVLGSAAVQRVTTGEDEDVATAGDTGPDPAGAGDEVYADDPAVERPFKP